MRDRVGNVENLRPLTEVISQNPEKKGMRRVVIRNQKGDFKNVKMSKEKRGQNTLGCIIKVFKEIIEALSKMVSNHEKWDEKEEKGKLEKEENHTKNRLR